MKKRTVTINKADSLVSIRDDEDKYQNNLVPMPVIKCSWEDYKKGREIANAKGRK